MAINLLKIKKDYRMVVVLLIAILCFCGLFKTLKTNNVNQVFDSNFFAPQTTADFFNDNTFPTSSICGLTDQLLSFTNTIELPTQFVILFSILLISIIALNNSLLGYLPRQQKTRSPPQKIHLIKCSFLE